MTSRRLIDKLQLDFYFLEIVCKILYLSTYSLFFLKDNLKLLFIFPRKFSPWLWQDYQLARKHNCELLAGWRWGVSKRYGKVIVPYSSFWHSVWHEWLLDLLHSIKKKEAKRLASYLTDLKDQRKISYLLF